MRAFVTFCPDEACFAFSSEWKQVPARRQAGSPSFSSPPSSSTPWTASWCTRRPESSRPRRHRTLVPRRPRSRNGQNCPHQRQKEILRQRRHPRLRNLLQAHPRRTLSRDLHFPFWTMDNGGTDNGGTDGTFPDSYLRRRPDWIAESGPASSPYRLRVLTFPPPLRGRPAFLPLLRINLISAPAVQRMRNADQRAYCQIARLIVHGRNLWRSRFPLSQPQISVFCPTSSFEFFKQHPHQPVAPDAQSPKPFPTASSLPNRKNSANSAKTPRSS